MAQFSTSFNMLMRLWCTRYTTFLRLLVPQFIEPARPSAFFFAAWTHDILYKNGGGIVLSKAHAASSFDPDWWQAAATIGKFQVFGSIFLCRTYKGNSN
jgi:hypothetical protein